MKYLKAKERILGKYKEIVNDKPRVQVLESLIAPCIGGKVLSKATNSLVKSKFGGYPDLPEGFDLAKYKELPLSFLAQFNFAELKAYDIEDKLPEKGVLSIFMLLDDGEQRGVPIGGIMQSFYFEDSLALSPCKDSTLTIPELQEVFVEFFEYLDLPESYDYRFVDKIDNWDAASEWDAIAHLQNELIPEIFGNVPLKVLGYPTYDSPASYENWFCFEKDIDPYEDSAVSSKGTEEEYELLFQLNLEALGGIVFEEDAFISFGGLSIGIRKEDLAEQRFDNLLFSYSIS